MADKLIGPSQMTFIPGCYTIHELHRKKQDGVILKLDFEKAHDKLKWPFIQQVLRMKGFSSTWCEWISKVISRGSVAVKVNDNTGHYFQMRKGVRCNTPGVWLPHLHLHFINMSIIHPFMSLDCMKHAFQTLQHMFIFHVCLFYEMNSVQHSSATHS